ncbi:putative phytol kinase 2, chloroplastic [Dendrobium catenatum]|uniref:Putative phytol kinase 2, chloroplastic n=1 Tax=Dendrobium catenatum TaxID=906689 RepID=A0A2I0WVG3_9ASPA|nr:putative phytol kinase 2, chloroplastic [Dendrobium catenatum]
MTATSLVVYTSLSLNCRCGIMLAIWVPNQADESFVEAWKPNAASSLPIAEALAKAAEFNPVDLEKMSGAGGMRSGRSHEEENDCYAKGGSDIGKEFHVTLLFDVPLKRVTLAHSQEKLFCADTGLSGGESERIMSPGTQPRYMHYFASFGFIEESWSMILSFLLVSVAAAVVESLPVSSELDDNLTVPLTSLLVGAVVF